jgi:hypothetical protein
VTVATNEAVVQQDSKASIHCYPLEANQDGLHHGIMFFYSREDATHMALLNVNPPCFNV